MKAIKNKFFSVHLRSILALCWVTFVILLIGCSTGTIITRLAVEPQWICPGQDFSPKVDFRLENIDNKGNPSSEGTCLWALWETSKAKPNQPGAIALTNKVGKLNYPSTGVWETPGGVNVIGGSLASGYNMTLIASNTECDADCEKYIKDHQAEIEKLFGVDLDDNEVMTAHATVELLGYETEKKFLCIPHAEDVVNGFTWVSDETSAGIGIAIDGIENQYSFSLEVKHDSPTGPVSVVLRPAGDPNAKSVVFNGQSPNGKWEIKTLNSADYRDYIEHELTYVGKPSICIVVNLTCIAE
jgi:hypothetical protein